MKKSVRLFSGYKEFLEVTYSRITPKKIDNNLHIKSNNLEESINLSDLHKGNYEKVV